jgi:outer membrane protein assembly factor BamB
MRRRANGFLLGAVGWALVLLAGNLEAANSGADLTNDWPTGRGPHSDGKSPLTGIRKDWAGGLRKVWETAELSQGDVKTNVSMSSPVIARGVAVVMGRSNDKDLVFGFEAETGKKLWVSEYPAKAEKQWSDVGNGARAAPVIEEDLVYTLSAYGHLACWELRTGNRKWLLNARDDSKTQVPFWGVCGSPAIYGKNILVKVGGYDQGPNGPLVMAYDKATGKLAWKSADAPGSWAPLAVLRLAGEDQLLAWHSGGLKALDPTNGKELWNIPWRTSYDCHVSLPAVEGSDLFLTSGYRTGCQAFSLKGGRPTPLWPANKAVASCCSAPVVHAGHIYSFTGNGADGALKCLELKTGTEKWSTPDFANGTLVLVDGCLLCLGYKGKLGLVEASPDAYRKLGEMKVFDAQEPPAYAAPAVACGKVYVRYLGKMVCYDLLR